MPQWRKLHTKTLDSLDVNDMPDDFTRLLWVILPLILDRCGRGIDNAAWVRAKAFPLREDVTTPMVADALDWFSDRGMIETYIVADRDYFAIPTWHQHQGKTLREMASNIPARVSQELVTQDARVSQELVKTSSRPTHAQKRVDVDVEESRVDVDAKPRDNAFTVYEHSVGQLTKTISGLLSDSIDECEAHRLALPLGASGSDIDGDAWVSNAIIEGVTSSTKGPPNIKYIQSILDRWRAEGYKATPHWAKTKGGAAPSTVPAPPLITELEPVA